MVFNGKPALYSITEGALDLDSNLHGQCRLGVKDQTEVGKIGQHPFLKWQPILIEGYFNHGVLDGPAIFYTFLGNKVAANFQNGVMHGPVYSTGISMIMMDKYKVIINCL